MRPESASAVALSLVFLASSFVAVSREVAAVPFATAAPADPTRLLGGEVLVYQFDQDDWDLQFPDSVEDRSGNSITGMAINAGSRPTGIYDGAAGFTQSQSNIQPVNKAPFAALTQDIAVMAWVRMNSFSGVQCFYSQKNSGSAEVISACLSGGQASIGIRNSANVFLNYGFGSANIQGNTWRHVAFVVSSNTVTYLVNGVTQGSAARVGTGILPGTVGYVGLGHIGGVTSTFNGNIDEFRLYDRALLPPEIVSIKDLPYLHPNDPPVLEPVGPVVTSEDAAVAFDVVATDPTSDPLTLAVDSLPAGAAFDGSTFAWTPSFDQAGEYIVRFKASDGLLEVSQDVSITVQNTNRPPSFAPVESPVVGREMELVVFDVAASDADGDAISLSAVEVPSGAGFGAEGRFSWLPSFDQAGSHQVTITASDGAEIAQITVPLFVLNVNRAPIANAGPDLEVECTGALTPVTLDASASVDPDGDPLAYGWVAEQRSLEPADAAVTTATLQVGRTIAHITVTDGEYQTQDALTVDVLDSAGPNLASTSPSVPGVYHRGRHVSGGDHMVVLERMTLRASALDVCSSAAVHFRTSDGLDVLDVEAPFEVEYRPTGVGLDFVDLSISSVDSFGNVGGSAAFQLRVMTASLPS